MGENYTLSCSAQATDEEQITSLQWRNSINHTLEMSTGPSAMLALHFQPLRISDGGNYTCIATYNNGGSRHTSEIVFVKGKYTISGVYIYIEGVWVPSVLSSPVSASTYCQCHEG